MNILWTLVLALGFGFSGGDNNTDCTAANDLVLTASFDHDKLGDSELTGALFNKSAGKDYDDVSVKVEFYDENSSMIGSQVYMITEDVDAGEVEDFHLKFKAPDNTTSANWSVICVEKD